MENKEKKILKRLNWLWKIGLVSLVIYFIVKMPENINGLDYFLSTMYKLELYLFGYLITIILIQVYHRLIKTSKAE